jgi:hypothetical protein
MIVIIIYYVSSIVKIRLRVRDRKVFSGIISTALVFESSTTTETLPETALGK